MREMRKWRDILIEHLAADPTAAIGFLQAVMEDYQVFGNSAAVVSAVQAVVEAQGGVAEVAKRTSMDPPKSLRKCYPAKTHHGLTHSEPFLPRLGVDFLLNHWQLRIVARKKWMWMLWLHQKRV